MTDTLYKNITNSPDVIGDMLTTTSNNIRKEITDNIYEDSAMLSWINKNATETISGGENIVVPIQIDKNSTAAYVQPNDVLNITPNNTLATAIYDPAVLVGSVSISDVDIAKNNSKEKLFDLQKHKEQDVLKAMVELQASSLFATAPGTNDLNSLVELVSASDPSRGAVGRINRTSTPIWQANELTIGSVATNGLTKFTAFMRLMAKNSGSQMTSLLCTTSAVYTYIEKLVIGNTRVADKSMYDAGFENISILGKTMIFDEDCPTGYMFFLNPKFIKMKVYSSLNWKHFPYVKPANQINRTKQVVLLGNMCVSRPNKLGIGTGATA